MNKILKMLSYMLLLIYLITLVYMMLFSFGRFTREEYSYNLVPFATIKSYLQFDQFNTDIWVTNLIGNIGVFIPFGILLPIVTKSRALWSYTVFLFIIFVLEMAQLLSRRGTLDIDDFILNSVGFWVGLALYKILIKIFIKSYSIR